MAELQDRKSPPAVLAKSRAVQRAKQRLAEIHPEEYRDILEVEKAREGIRSLQPRQVTQ